MASDEATVGGRAKHLDDELGSLTGMFFSTGFAPQNFWN